MVLQTEGPYQLVLVVGCHGVPMLGNKMEITWVMGELVTLTIGLSARIPMQREVSLALVGSGATVVAIFSR